MAVSFFKDANSWKINGSPVPNGVYRAFYQGTGTTARITVVHPQYGNRPIIANTLVTDIQKDASGATYADLKSFDKAVGSFFLSASVGGAGATVSSDHVFTSDTARDTYFTTDPNQSELLPGLTIVSGGEIQRWAAATPATTGDYVGTNFVSITGAALNGAQIKILYEDQPDTNALTDAKRAILDVMSINSSGDVVFSVSAIFPPGSAQVGDSIIESGGRIITAQSKSTGNQGAFLIQLFDSDSYLPATIYDASQTAQTFDIQTTDSSVTSPATELNFRQVVQNDVQFQAIDFMPDGGSVTSNFTIEIRLSQTGEPIYKETITPADVIDQTGGVFRYELINPSQFDAGFSAFVKITGIALLGGAFDGSDGVRFGDSANSNFFPWLRSFAIPIVRQNIATEDYVDNEVGNKEDSLGNPSENGQVLVSQTDGTRSWEDKDGNDYVDSADFTIDEDGNVSLTLGRSGALNDLSDTIQFIEGTNVTLTPDVTNKTITINATGVQSYHAPTLSNFTVDIPSRVDVGTDLNVNHIFTFEAHNSANLSSLIIRVTSGTNQTITLPINDGTNSFTFELSGIVSSSATTVTFQLVGEDTQSNEILSNVITINVANVQTHEQTHFGAILSTEDQTDINFTNDDIEARENAPGNWVVSGLPSTGLHRIYFAVPTTDNVITRIVQSGFTLYDSALTTGNQFTLISNVTISGNTYNVLLMNATSAVNASYNGQTLITS